METEGLLRPRGSRPIPVFHFLLARRQQSGVRLFNLGAIRVFSVGDAIEAVSERDLGLLGELIRANVPLLVVSEGALLELGAGGEGPGPVGEGRAAGGFRAPPCAQGRRRRSDGAPPAGRNPGSRDLHDSLMTLSSLSLRPVSARIRRAIDFILAHYAEAISLSDVSREACLSPCYFCRLFKRELETTYSKYLASVRVENAARLLLQSELSVTEICFQVGFNDLTHFGRVFRRFAGLTPSQFRGRTRRT